jgi:hypothetical protein
MVDQEGFKVESQSRLAGDCPLSCIHHNFLHALGGLHVDSFQYAPWSISLPPYILTWPLMKTKGRKRPPIWWPLALQLGKSTPTSTQDSDFSPAEPGIPSTLRVAEPSSSRLALKRSSQTSRIGCFHRPRGSERQQWRALFHLPTQRMCSVENCPIATRTRQDLTLNFEKLADSLSGSGGRKEAGSDSGLGLALHLSRHVCMRQSVNEPQEAAGYESPQTQAKASTKSNQAVSPWPESRRWRTNGG